MIRFRFAGGPWKVVHDQATVRVNASAIVRDVFEHIRSLRARWPDEFARRDAYFEWRQNPDSIRRLTAFALSLRWKPSAAAKAALRGDSKLNTLIAAIWIAYSEHDQLQFVHLGCDGWAVDDQVIKSRSARPISAQVRVTSYTGCDVALFGTPKPYCVGHLIRQTRSTSHTTLSR